MASSLDKLEANDVEDAVDRAMRYRQFDKSRVPLKLIGFWPGNRGGVGISSNQVHEVCKDIMGQKCRIQRYDHVDLVEVLEPMLTEFKRVNKTKCDDDPLMPAFSPEMKYVPLMKNTLYPCLQVVRSWHSQVKE